MTDLASPSDPQKSKSNQAKKNSTSSSLSDFVSEQPGLGLSLIGLFLAFFMGLSIRAITAPERIHDLVQQATDSVHKDIQIHFNSASFSLSQGIFPDLSVVIEGVEIESEKSCWFTPLAEIHQIRLPLSLKHLLKGQILIHEVIADEINLSLRSELKPCSEISPKAGRAPVGGLGLVDSNPRASTIESVKAKATQTVVSSLENVKRENPIDHFQVGVLKIHYLPIAFTSAEINNFNAELKNPAPKLIEMTGTLQASSPAQIKISYQEGEQASLKTLIEGQWREGDYKLLADLDLKSQSLRFESDVHHLPLSQVIPVLKKYRLMQSEFNGRQAWLSGHLQTSGPLDKILKNPTYLTDIKLEGDLGEVDLAKAEIKSWEPFEFDPFDFQIRGLNLKELLVFLNRPHPSPALGALGSFNGRAHFINPEHLSLKGDYSGLEFIFSNRGDRQIQTLSQVSGEISLNQKKWTVQIDRMKPADGIFEGQILMSAEKDFRDLEIQAQIQELTLSPAVQSLMTGGGSLGAIQGQIKTHLKQAEILELNGQIKSDRVVVEGLRLLKPKISLETRGQEIWMNLTSPALDLPQKSILFSDVLSPLLTQMAYKVEAPPLPSESQISLKDLSMQMQTWKFNSLSWSSLQARMGRQFLKSKGGWNSKAEMYGEISLSGPPEDRWDIRGTRNQPKLVLQREKK